MKREEVIKELKERNIKDEEKTHLLIGDPNGKFEKVTRLWTLRLDDTLTETENSGARK